MDASESRLTTIGVGCFAAASVAFFAAVYAPALSSVAPGSGIRPWSVLLLLSGWLGWNGWIARHLLGLLNVKTPSRPLHPTGHAIDGPRALA